MDSHKSKLLETMEHVSKFAGSLTGKVVVCSKEIADYAVNLAIGKPVPKPSSKAAEATKSQATKEIAEPEEKKATSEQEQLKKKTDKSKPSVGSQSCPKTKAGEKPEIIAISKKRRPTVTKKKKSSTRTSGPAAKN
jgi:hypothetical protein